MHQKVIYKIPNGDKFDEFVFDPEGKGKSRYQLNGIGMTGVTTILGAIAKPNLIDWAATEAYKDSIGKNREEIETILKDKTYAHKRRSDSAKDIGKDAHDWVERYIKSKIEGKEEPKLDQETAHICIRFKEWAVNNNVKFIASELSVFSRKYFYAGTFDFVCEIEGKRYLGDFKTSSGIYGREYFAQCAAYRIAIEENGAFTQNGTRMDLSNVTGSIIVRSDKLTDEEVGVKNQDTFNKYKSNRYAKTPFEVAESVTDYPKDVKYFLGALVVYKEGFEYEVEIDTLINK